MTRFGYRHVCSVVLSTLVASVALAQTPAPEDFVLFADQTLRARGLIVTSGDVGANVSLKGTKRIDAASSRLVSNTVDLHPASSCAALLANSGRATGNCGPATPVSTPIIADVAAACGAPNPFPTCNPGASVFVAHDATTTLQPGVYGDVIVSGGGAGPGTLILAGGSYTFCNMRVNRNGVVQAQAPVQVHVAGTTKFDNGSNVGPQGQISPCQFRIFSNGAKFRVSRKGALRGVVCAPNAKLEFTAGANLRGVFFGREVKSDKVTLQHESCLTTTTTTTTTTLPQNTCGNGIVDPSEPCDPSSPGGAFNCPAGATCSAQCTCETATTTSTTTTTLPGDDCGNGVVDPSEPCDPSSPGGAFNCPPGSTCTDACTCASPATTSTSAAPTTSSTSTSTTTTIPNELCGNGQVDPEEPCDPSSPGGAFECPDGSTCSEICTCLSPTTSSSSTTAPASTSSTSTAPVPTTTTSSTPAPTTTTSSTPVPTTTTSSTPASTTTSSTGPAPTTTTTSSSSTSSSSSSSTSSSTTVTPTTSAPTTTTTGGVPTAFEFLATAGGGICGRTFRETTAVTPLKNLLCGNLSLGGGASQVPDNTTPPGATNRFAVSNCAGGTCTVGPIATGTPDFDCTNTGCFFGTPLPISNAGLSVCVTNTFSQPVAGTLNTTTGAVTMTTFQLNSATVLTGLPTQPCPRCAVSVGGAACVGSPASPCTGVCDGSPNQGAACTTENPGGLTSQCPSPNATTGTQRCYRGANNNNVCSTGGDCPGGLCAQFIGNIPITLSPLTTGTTSLSSATGLFCSGQTATQKGAFRSSICQTGANSGQPCDTTADCGGAACRLGTLNNFCAAGTNQGKGCVVAADCGTGGQCVKAGPLAQLIQLEGAPAGALSVGVSKAIKLASVFCVPQTESALVNSNANLPGPGATALVGNITLLP
jgi:hypothetical protein